MDCATVFGRDAENAQFWRAYVRGVRASVEASALLLLLLSRPACHVILHLRRVLYTCGPAKAPSGWVCPVRCGLQRAYDDASSTAGDNLLHLVMSFFSASGVQGGQLLACAGSAAKSSLLNESPAGRRGCCREEEPGSGRKKARRAVGMKLVGCQCR